MNAAAVTVRRSACLRSRLRTSGCSACADACPAQALRVGRDGVTLQAGCTGCGRCRAACPMGAIAVSGFGAAAEREARAGGATLLVDCARFGVASAAPDSIRVPCLGGLSPGDLLALCARAAGRTVLLADHDACMGCDSGRTAHAAAAVLQTVTELMREANVPEERLPRLVRRPPQPLAADPMQSEGRARRGFFSALVHPAASEGGTAAAGRASPARQQAVAALRTLAARHQGRVPQRLFHRVEVGPSCQGHRGCAAACPTGALLRYRDARTGRAGIAFDAQLCIGCAHCAQTCPEQALTLLRGAGSPDVAARVLTAFPERECTDCGARFAAPAPAAQAQCASCRRAAELARSAFAALFPARTPLHPE